MLHTWFVRQNIQTGKNYIRKERSLLISTQSTQMMLARNPTEVIPTVNQFNSPCAHPVLLLL